MYRNVFLIAISLLLFKSMTVSAATLHSILIADTSNPKVNYAQASLELMKTLVDEIASNSDMTLKSYPFDSKFDYADVKSNLNNLSVDKDDAILFYYAGYGLNMNTLLWPHLVLKEKDQVLDFEKEVISVLTQKQPRLLIVLGDVGNEFEDLAEKGLVIVQKSTSNRDSYRKLFAEAKGSLIATAANLEQLAGGNAEGGYFTANFLNTIHKELKMPNPSWKQITEKMEQSEFKVETASGERLQVPIVEANFSQQSQCPSIAGEITSDLINVTYSYRKEGDTGMFSTLNEGSSLSTGDDFKVHLSPSETCQEGCCWISVCQYDSDKNMYSIFPNPEVTLENPVKEAITLPSDNDSYYLGESKEEIKEYILVSVYSSESEFKPCAELQLSKVAGGIRPNNASTAPTCTKNCINQITFSHQ
jgi:hypothetical protein